MESLASRIAKRLKARLGKGEGIVAKAHKLARNLYGMIKSGRGKAGTGSRYPESRSRSLLRIRVSSSVICARDSPWPYSLSTSKSGEIGI